MDPNDSDMVYCPYNKEHKMLRKKLQQHVLKCRVLYKDTVNLMVCPFNKGHLIPEPEYYSHIKICDDRKIIIHYQTNGSAVLSEDTKHAKIESEENWDDDDTPDYEPQAYCTRANILREPPGMFPAERKAFIKEETKRKLGVDYEEEAKAARVKAREENRHAPYNSNQQRSKRRY